jgi:hypothetical protein
MTVACAALGFGQNKQEATPAKSAAAAERKHAGGKDERVKVHGHWVLEIRNPDGSLAQRKELENALVVGGRGALAQLLNGGAVVGGWYIVLQPQPQGASSGIAIAQNAQVCAANLLQLAASCSPSLTISLSPDSTQLILQGTSAPVASNVPITQVGAYLLTCPPGTPYATCAT